MLCVGEKVSRLKSDKANIIKSYQNANLQLLSGNKLQHLHKSFNLRSALRLRQTGYVNCDGFLVCWFIYSRYQHRFWISSNIWSVSA